MPLAVSDVPSNASEQIAHAAKVIGKSPQARLVFSAIHTGKMRWKSVPWIAARTGLTQKQVLTHGKKFTDSGLIESRRVGNRTEYQKNDFLHRHKRRILASEGKAAKRKMPDGRTINIIVRGQSRSNGVHRPRPKASTKIKILFIAANPTPTVAIDPKTRRPLVNKPLGLDREFREIQAKIRASAQRDRIELASRWAATPDDLLQAFNEEQPHVVHFSGHGSSASQLVLLDETGEPKPVSKKALSGLFRAMKDNIRVVFLNACFSKAQADSITKHIDCAIGMSKAIGDEAAITFAASFYRAIGFGRSVKSAFEQGRSALQLEGINEDRTPKLISRKGVNPDAVRLIND